MLTLLTSKVFSLSSLLFSAVTVAAPQAQSAETQRHGPHSGQGRPQPPVPDADGGAARPPDRWSRLRGHRGPPGHRPSPPDCRLRGHAPQPGIRGRVLRGPRVTSQSPSPFRALARGCHQ